MAIKISQRQKFEYRQNVEVLAILLSEYSSKLDYFTGLLSDACKSIITFSFLILVLVLLFSLFFVPYVGFVVSPMAGFLLFDRFLSYRLLLRRASLIARNLERVIRVASQYHDHSQNFPWAPRLCLELRLTSAEVSLKSYKYFSKKKFFFF